MLIRINDGWSRRRLAWKRRLGWVSPVRILAHRGWGNREVIRVGGRILESEGLSQPSANDSPWTNFVRTVKRFESDELPGVPLTAAYEGRTYRGCSDREGYFEFLIPVRGELAPNRSWHHVQVRMPEKLHSEEDQTETTAEVMIPRPDARFGVISDIDDTVLETGATQPLKMIGRSLFRNAYSRSPIPGVAEVYQQLAQDELNPVFYLSSSPWNLYDLIRTFLDHHSFPKGPLFLQPWGLDPAHWMKPSHEAHKKARCRELLERFAPLSFILIGDAGEKDADIYADLTEEYPGRIEVIYIRAVGGRSASRLESAAERSKKNHVPMVEIMNSAQMAEDLHQRGLVA